MLEPIEAEAEQALVNPVGAINEAGFALSNDKQTDAYHPDVSQTGRYQEPTDADRFREMTLVDVKATALLVGKQGFDAKTTLVEPTSRTRLRSFGVYRRPLSQSTIDGEEGFSPVWPMWGIITANLAQEFLILCERRW